MRSRVIVDILADAFLAGEQTVDAIVDRAVLVLGKRHRWMLPPLARRYLAAYATGTRPRHRDVVQFFFDDPRFSDAWHSSRRKWKIEHWLSGPQLMHPVTAAEHWPLPTIETAGALAAWLQLDPKELDWFADLKAFAYHHPDLTRVSHYRYRIVRKTSGGMRLIESPKPRLKAMQRRVLHEILYGVPPHDAVHGFVPGRSIRTFAAPHTGKRVVLRMDLRNFFPSFSGARIQALFRTLGYPESVADFLGGISTNAVPRSTWRDSRHDSDPRDLWELRDLHARPHLPQGAPTSPWLANLCTYRADCRLTGLAHVAGAQYTRYADDLAFSGDVEFEKRVERFATHVAAILHEEGLAVHHRKTRIMRQGVRQYLAGIVTNRHPNIPRPDYDRLKAILNNCIRLGPQTQNRENHPDFRSYLMGHIAFVAMINPARGQRLRAAFEQIHWPG